MGVGGGAVQFTRLKEQDQQKEVRPASDEQWSTHLGAVRLTR